MAFNSLMQKNFWKMSLGKHLMSSKKKPDLMTLAKELKLDVKRAMRKQEIKNMLIDRLVADDLLDGFCLDDKVIVDDGSD